MMPQTNTLRGKNENNKSTPSQIPSNQERFNSAPFKVPPVVLINDIHPILREEYKTKLEHH